MPQKVHFFTNWHNKRLQPYCTFIVVPGGLEMGTMKKFRYYDPCTCVALSEHASSDAFVGMKRTICVKARKDPSRTRLPKCNDPDDTWFPPHTWCMRTRRECNNNVNVVKPWQDALHCHIWMNVMERTVWCPRLPQIALVRVKRAKKNVNRHPRDSKTQF